MRATPPALHLPPALLLDLNSSGQTLILVTHNPDLAARYTQRTITIADGRLTAGVGR